jgi:hypothetical protein
MRPGRAARLIACLLAGLLLAGAQGAAAAPEGQGTSAAKAAPKQGRSLDGHVTVEQSYTDNLNLATTRGGEDFLTKVRPGFSLAADSPAQGAVVNYDFGLSRYWKLDEQFTSHELRGKLWQGWEHVRLDAAGGFSRQESPIEVSPETGAVLGLRNAVKPYYRANGAPGVTYEFGPGCSVRAGYNYSTYWGDDVRFQNSQMNSPNVSVAYALDPFNVVRANYAYELGSFSRGGGLFPTSNFAAHRGGASYTRKVDTQLDVTAACSISDLSYGSGTGYQTDQLTLGTSYGFSESLKGSLSAGYYYVDKQGQGRSGPNISGTLTKIFPRGRVSVSGERGVGEDYYSAENLGLYDFWGGRIGATLQLAERLAGHLAAGWRRSDFFSRGRTDDSWNAGGGLSWVISPWLTGRADYSHTVQQSAATAGFQGILWNFTANTVTFGLAATYR